MAKRLILDGTRKIIRISNGRILTRKDSYDLTFTGITEGTSCSRCTTAESVGSDAYWKKDFKFAAATDFNGTYTLPHISGCFFQYSTVSGYGATGYGSTTGVCTGSTTAINGIRVFLSFSAQLEKLVVQIKSALSSNVLSYFYAEMDYCDLTDSITLNNEQTSLGCFTARSLVFPQSDKVITAAATGGSMTFDLCVL